MAKPEADMADEYDFSRGERGRFHRPGSVLTPPVHLDPGVLEVLQKRASEGGMSLSALVNLLLKRDIEQMEKAG